MVDLILHPVALAELAEAAAFYEERAPGLGRDLFEEIWESISTDPTSMPVSEAQLPEARRRLAEHDADPTTAVPWEKAEARLRAKT